VLVIGTAVPAALQAPACLRPGHHSKNVANMAEWSSTGKELHLCRTCMTSASVGVQLHPQGDI
jgi:hypothetical protein